MADGFHAGLFDELEALYPDSSGGAAQYGVAAAKGTVAGVHILLTGLTPGQPVSIEVPGRTRPSSSSNWCPCPWK